MAQITYNFRAVGAESVQRAFQSIGTSAEQSARATIRSQRSAGQGAARQASEVATAARASSRATEAEAKKASRAVEKSAQDGVRANQKAAQQAARAAQAEIKAKERALAYVARLRTNYFAQEQRQAERHDRSEKQRAEKRMAMEQRAKQRASKERWGGLGDDVKSVGKGLALTAGAAITATIGAATRDSMALQEKANRISINARGAGEEFQDPTAMRKSFEATAIATPGIKAIEIADAVQRYVSLTGDTKTGLSSQGTFATVASATGTDVGAIAEAAASLSKQFDITGIEDMRDALATLTMQGKAGAFELQDAAAQFQRLAAAGAAFGLDKGKQGAKTLGGLTQIARSGTGSAEEATTSVTGMFAAFNSKQKQLKGAGVNVFGKDGKRRNIEDLLVETIGKVGGTSASKKAAGLNQIFGEQGGKAINPLLNTYNAAFQGAKGTDAERQKVAMDALRASIQKATNAPGTWADVVEDAAQAQQSASAKLTGAWEGVTAKVGGELAPAITNLISGLASSGALDMAVSALGVFAAALGEVAQTMVDLGLIKPKTKTLDEKKSDAEKALASFDAQHGDIAAQRSALDLLPDSEERDAQVAKLDALEEQRNGLGSKIQDAEEARWQGKADSKTITPEEFKAQYAKLGGGGEGDFDEAARLSKMYRLGERPTEFLLTQENQEQENYRRQYEGQLTYDEMQQKNGGGGGSDPSPDPSMEASRTAMLEMAEAAKTAAEELRKVKPQASVIPPG